MTRVVDRNLSNCFILHDEEKGTYILQSYDSIVAVYHENPRTLVLGKDWNYSATTGKHMARFMREFTCFRAMSARDLRAALKDQESGILYDQSIC